MAIPALVSSLDAVDEKFRSLYRPTKGDDEPTGQFILDVAESSGVSLRNFQKLLGAVQEERTAAETATRKLKKYEALGAPDEVERKLARMTETETKLAELAALDPKREADKLAETKLQAALSEINRKHAEEIAKRDEEVKRLTGHIRSNTVDQEARRALAAAGVLQGHDDLLLRAIRDVAHVEEADGQMVLQIKDEKGSVRIKDANRTPFGMQDLVEELRTTYPGAFAAQDGKGSGTPPGASGGGGGQGQKKPSEMTPAEKAKLIETKGYDAFAKMVGAQTAA
mgnify:CR=1 FL=1